MNQLLDDQVALVTGGTKGIGKAIAIKFLEQGAHVVIVGRDVAAGNALADEHERCHFIQADVALESSAIEVVATLSAKFGRLDILVNNAGITKDKLLMRMSPEDFSSVLAVNVGSCYNFCKAASRIMMKARKGKIINMSSIVGLIGNSGQSNYAASKAAVIGFSKSLAKELAPRNIHVNCIAPGFVSTQMTDELTDEQRKEIFNHIPLKRFGKPEDVANVALFLASPLSDYVTAEVITVSGGFN